MEPIRRQIEMDGYLCGCGTHIILGERELYARAVPPETALHIKEALKRYQVEGVLEGRDGCHFSRERSRMPQLERMRSDIQELGYASAAALEDEGYEFDKFCCITDSHSDQKGFFQSLEAEFQIIDRGRDFWECVPKGHSKATGLQKVLDYYGISLEDAYVFGDSTNDLPMFTYAKNTILMGHHDLELEPYASFTTRTVEDDGIAYAMEALGLISRGA